MRIRIWRRRRDTPVRTEARAALKRAEDDRRQIQDRGPEVDRAVALLRQMRRGTTSRR
jgi:hypothetical protein